MNSDLALQAATVSRFKKERFLLGLSEDDFRDRVVRPLLFRQGLKDGRDYCGPTEKGKDAVFVVENPLGLKEVYVVQTKKGRLNLSRKATENILEATTQLRTALETRVTFVATREKKSPDKAILCASGKINDSAREHILNEIKDPRIIFLDPDDLIPLIDRHLPELWFDIDPAVRPYLHALKRSVESLDEYLLTDLGARPTAGAATDRMFVNLFLNRTEVTIRRRHGRVEREPKIIEIPIGAITRRSDRLVLITGSAGSGKSTALRRIAYVLIDKSLSPSGAQRSQPHIPILLRASAVAANKDRLLQHLTKETTRLGDSKQPPFSAEDLRDGRVVLLIDGLDELAGDEARTSVLRKVLDFNHEHRECQVIVTSRDYSFVTMLKELAPFTRFSLSPISLNQAQQLLEKIERARQLPIEASKEIMRRLQQVHGFELNPLLVTVFAATSDYSRRDIPANITELFKKYTEMMLGRWSASKGLGQQFHAPLKDFLLRQVAFEMHRRQITNLHIDEFKSLIAGALSARGLTAEIDLLLDEILHQSGLFRITETSVEFRHLLLQEFFAGRGIPSRDYLEPVIAEDWWQRAVVFFFGEHPDDIRGLQSACGAVQLRTDPERYRASITLGLALQAAYLVEVKDRADLLKWVLQVMARSKRGFIEAATAGGSPSIMAFTFYYLFGRDAVACNIPAQAGDVIGRQLHDEAADEDERDACQFWQIIAKLETGLDEDVDRVIRKYNPRDARLLFGVYLSLRFIAELRVSSKAQRAMANDLAAKLHERVAPVIGEFTKVFRTLLLEIRRGEIQAVPTEAGRALTSGSSE